MSISWIVVTPKLRTGIDVVNSTETAQFAELLSQIKRLRSDNTFTKTELESMQERLGLSPQKLELYLQTVFYIFKQSTKVILKPTTLQRQLVETLHFHADKAEVFVKAWIAQTKLDFDNLENRFKLNRTSWELNLQTSTPVRSKELLSNVHLKLGLSTSDPSSARNVTFELDEKELLQLYNTFESIQNKADFLRRTD